MIKHIKYIIGTILYIVTSAQYERPIATITFIIGESFSFILGTISASFFGWPSSRLGRGYKVIGSKGISVGRGSSIKRYAWIEAVFSYNNQKFTPSIKIGERFYASERIHISAIGRVEIGDNCLVGSSVYISDHNHGAYKGNQQDSPHQHPADRNLVSFGPVIIGSNVWLGDNVIIVGPVKIGDGVIVGANSLVIKDIPANVIAAGSPVKVLKTYNSTNNTWEKYINKDP
jgi:acetyltransferase-like isoleucine patch superfamily enzyme